MIPAGTCIFLALDPIDLRCGFNRLSGIARETLGYDPRGGALFVFFGKRRHAIKILFWDGSGMCLFYKRLDKGRFRLLDTPETGATHVELNETELDALLDGIVLERPKKRAPSVH
jgi:transposase